MLTRILAIGLPTVAVLLGLGGVALGVGEPTMTGLSLEPQGGHVASVDPTSLAYAAGIRAGQRIVDETDASDRGGWSIITEDGAFEHGLSQAAATANARFGLAIAVVAVLPGLLGLAAAARHRRRAETLGTVGLVIATVPFAILHDPIAGPLGATLASLGVAAWLLRWANSRGLARAIFGATIALNVAWLVARFLGLAATPEIESVRLAFTVGLAVVVTAIGIGVTPRAIARRSAAVRYVDVTAAAAGLILAVALQMLLSPPPWAPIVVVAVVLLGYRGGRSEVGRWIDRVVFAEERERVAIASAESERARLSRELHDDPLQALAGVILSLGDQPQTERERETLRTVAGQLRNMATVLHPPVLDDLGLIPAFESLFADPGPVPIELELENGAGYRKADRPPFEVELASYRIIAEAAANAVRHSGCRRIVVRGSVSPGAVSLDVIDDGRGIRERDVEAALREGHLGVASMRRRAEAIDAHLAYVPGPSAGTIVRLRWSE
jgi:signal transduction histidine kinase